MPANIYHNTSATTDILHAGMLEMLYENGSLRYIRFGKEELLRRIYIALRDAEWGTFTPFLSKETRAAKENYFTINYDCHYKIRDSQIFKWEVQIEGNAGNEICFSIRGEALASFEKNRAGLCILHGAKSCSGQDCEITTIEGKAIKQPFPIFISPCQPFRNIRKMRWTASGNITCELQFEGDVFETEDQRNWTDASFKTYSTPLHLPHPVLLQEGDKISQRMIFHACPKKDIYLIQKEKEQENLLKFDLSNPLQWPGLGTSLPVHGNISDKRETALLRKLDLDHYRVDLRLYDKEWYSCLQRNIDKARLLRSGLEIALHIDENEKELKKFIAIVKEFSEWIHKITLLGPSKITSNSIIEKYVPLLRKNIPNVKIGGGTDCYFAELNRNIPDTTLLDFISFSINPQVHAFDDLTLIENMEAQHDAVTCAKKLYPRMPVHVSPVTLMPRFNPDAAGEFVSGNMPANKKSDPRQKTIFAAGWTLGSFRFLTAAGVSSITYYETSGDKGLMPHADASNSNSCNKVYPVYLLLYLMMEFKKGRLFAGISNDPLKYNGMLFVKEKHQCWIIANHLPKTINIKIDHLKNEARLRTLDSGNYDHFMQYPDLFFNSKSLPLQSNTIQLKPYAIGIVDKK